MLETSPIEGKLVTPEFDEAHKGECSKGEEEGQKDRSKKSVNHNARIFSAATLLQLKSDAKVGIKITSLEFRDSFGTDGTISVLPVLNRYKIGTNTACCYSAF